MAHKAESQIKLNETRDLLREINQSVNIVKCVFCIKIMIKIDIYFI